MHNLIRLTCTALALAAWAAGQAPRSTAAAGTTNPFNSPQDIEQAAPLFQTHCTYCHGTRGEGGRGADLTAGIYNHGGTDADLYNTIRNGIPGAMPAVPITDDEVWKLVAYVRKLGSAGLAEKATGDAMAGKAVFEGKGKCMTCHSLGLVGGTVGPDLSDVGRRRDLKYLTESLVNPAADVPIRYRAVQVVLKNNQTVTGIRLNEDDVSIQVRDTSDNLRSFKKDSIKEIKHDKPALMPSYSSTLSKTDLDNVVAYLHSLRGEQQ